MTLREIIDSLLDQARDRKYMAGDDPESIFLHDEEALLGAVQFLREIKDEQVYARTRGMNEIVKRQVQLLRTDGYLDAAEIEWQCRHFNLAFELAHITEFAVAHDSGDPLVREQLRALWTAYCFHADYIVDTAPYDNALQGIWTVMEDAGQTRGFAGFRDFDNFMCNLLV